MPLNGRLLWTELLDEIQRRQSENSTAPSPQFDIPYFQRSDVEQTLWEVSNSKLREVGVTTMGNIASGAVTSLSGASPLSMPANAIGVINVTIDGGPAVEVDPDRFYFMNTGPATKLVTFANRQLLFIGTSADVNILIEPDLSVWQSDPQPSLLPPGYDEERIADVCEILELQDYLPAGRT